MFNNNHHQFSQPYPGDQDESYGYSQSQNYAYDYYDPQQGYGADYNQAESYWNQGNLVAGEFYPDPSMPVLYPQVYDSPISALAFDKGFEALYVATATQVVSGKHHGHRASMLVTHSALDGSLYSSVAGHPQAESETLQSVYSAIYGPPQLTKSKPIPTHAFRPYYGPGVASKMAGDMGINSLIPMSGYVASVSPSGVRLHATGGLQVADWDVEGMICGTEHNRDSTFVTVGGLLKNRQPPLACVDVYQGMRVVCSGRLDGAESGNSVPVAVSALASESNKGSIVAGCTDGYVRLLDERLRPLARVKSHRGGITCLATSSSGNLFATAGYGPRSERSSQLYQFPDPGVCVFDIRYLGRGSSVKPFSGRRGGPRYLSFLPGDNEDRLVIASGQTGGGVEIQSNVLGSSSDSKSVFLQPDLEGLESISCICQEKDKMLLGTSLGRVSCFKMHEYVEREVLPSSKLFTPDMSRNDKTVSRKNPPKLPLNAPDAVPSKPLLSFSPASLSNDRLSAESAQRESLASALTSYVLVANASTSATTTFLNPGKKAVVLSKRRSLAENLLAFKKESDDFLCTASTAKVSIDPLKAQRKSIPNPNRLLYSYDLFSRAYSGTLRDSRRQKVHDTQIPEQYRGLERPKHRLASSYEHGDYNALGGLLAGWDYAAAMPNSFVCSVLLLLYMIPEVKSLTQPSQKDGIVMSEELEALFYRLDCLCYGAVLSSSQSLRFSSAWSPSSFLSALCTMPEADRLQILDTSPEAIHPARRPEAFIRFLLYHLSSEARRNSTVLDSLCGTTFRSVNDFIESKCNSESSESRVLTVELKYARDDGSTKRLFSDILQNSLFSQTRLRAWNKVSKSYETIVQRKTVTSLPPMLVISCGCAGQRPEDGLCFWRQAEECLPEAIAIELSESGTVSVAELRNEDRTESANRRIYKLHAVVSWINGGDDDSKAGGHGGHHVLHTRLTEDFIQSQRTLQRRALHQESQRHTVLDVTNMTNARLKKDSDSLDRRLLDFDAEPQPKEQWALVNGFSISEATESEVLSFTTESKEPSILVFRDESEIPADRGTVAAPIPPTVFLTKSLTDGSLSPYMSSVKDIDNLCSSNCLLAMDAEFVAVGDEDYVMNESGSKVTIRETRHAVARISVVDCPTGKVVLDDYVLPKEPVTDYLTRFSGVERHDLDPALSPHHLITPRSAYLKIRYLVEQGVFFIGHGLKNDFWTMNLFVSDAQIIDTVEIYHKPCQRYISLRFLTNMVFKHDMQEEVHDSVEDAKAAYELYKHSLSLKRQDAFDNLLDDIYTKGEAMDWKVGGI